MWGKTVQALLPVAKQFQSSAPTLTARASQQMYMACLSHQVRFLSSRKFTKNIELISNTPRPLIKPLEKVQADVADSPLKFALERTASPASAASRLSAEEQPPLVIIMSWLMAKRKHVMKYAQFYLDQGFDVLSVGCSPIQLLFPVNGGQVIARDVLTFMTNNQQYSSTMLHGFSISGFVWGQVMAQMSQDMDKYQPVLDNIVGQIWDSPVDVEGISQGMGTAMFPNNWLLKTALEGYVRFHVNYYQEQATQHYLQSSIMYHNTLVQAPALFFCSEDDPVAFHYIVERAADRWEQKGIQVFMKTWKKSPHVSHMWKHPVEYKEEMKAFLDKLGLLKYPERFQVKSVAFARN